MKRPQFRPSIVYQKSPQVERLCQILNFNFSKNGFQIHFPEDRSGLKLTLYQYQTCPFCCKVRAFLDYYGISYDIIEVDPVLRQSIKWSTYKKVPILVAELSQGYQPLNDSSMIISALSTFLKDKKELREIVKCYPHITYIDEDGAKKSEIMNKYFLVLGQPTITKQIKSVLLKFRKLG